MTLDAGSYDAAKYRTARKQLAAKSVSYDEANARFYVASADAEFAALDKSFNEIEGYSHKLPNTPATARWRSTARAAPYISPIIIFLR